MAALIGYLHGSRGGVSRLGTPQSGIESKLETWHGSITTHLGANGTVEVYVGQKNSTGRLVWKGNVDRQEAEPWCNHDATADA